MMKKTRKIKILFCVTLVSFGGIALAATTIDPANKYACGADIWDNFSF